MITRYRDVRSVRLRRYLVLRLRARHESARFIARCVEFDTIYW